MQREEAYVCNGCGYVLPEKDALISDWDFESSLRHVRCPRCGKMIAHTPQHAVRCKKWHAKSDDHISGEVRGKSSHSFFI